MPKAFTDFEQRIMGNQKVKFKDKETKGGKFRKDLNKAIKELNLREKKDGISSTTT